MHKCYKCKKSCSEMDINFGKVGMPYQHKECGNQSLNAQLYSKCFKEQVIDKGYDSDTNLYIKKWVVDEYRFTKIQGYENAIEERDKRNKQLLITNNLK